jgi:hypothetical protein
VVIFATIGVPTTPGECPPAVVEGQAADSGRLPSRATGCQSSTGERSIVCAECTSLPITRPSGGFSWGTEGAAPLAARTDSRIERDGFGNSAKIGSLGVYGTSLGLKKVPAGQLLGTAVKQTGDTVR